MTMNSLLDKAHKIEEQLVLQEKLSEYLNKAEAIAYIACVEGFLDFKPFILHNYFWALGDLLTDAKKLNEQLLSILLQDDSDESRL